MTRDRYIFAAFIFWTSVLCVAGVFATDQEKDLGDRERRQKIHEIHKKQIPLLEQAIEKHSNSERVAEWLFRLGEAYYETSRIYEIEGEDSRSSLHHQKAREALERLRRQHPNYERIDEALLSLSSIYQERGQNAKAGEVLVQLAENYPESTVMNEASYLLGDYYFDEREFEKAKRYYKKAAQYDESKNYAHYKMAWVALNQGNPRESLNQFEQVVQTSQDGLSQRFDFSEDAAREMAWPAMQVHGGAGALDYLEATLKDSHLVKRSFQKLGAKLLDEGEYEDASRAYAELIDQFSNDPLVESWVSAQLEAEEKLGRTDRIVALVSRLKGDVGGSGEVASELISSAKRFHALAQAEEDASKRNQNYDQAISYYKAYLEVADKESDIGEANFSLAEALYQRGRKREAAGHYKQAAKRSSDKQLESAWKWYLAAEELAPGFNYQGDTRGSLQSSDREFLEAARFVANLSEVDREKRVKANYQAARLFYQINNYDQALPIFQSIVDQYPGTKQAELSAQLVLDIYNLQDDYESVALYAQRYRDEMDVKTQKEFSDLEMKARFKSIQERETRYESRSSESERISGLKRVAQEYLEYEREYSNTSLGATALWAAIQLQATVASYEDDRSFSSLRSNFQRFMSQYRNSEYAPKAVELMGEFIAYQQPEDQALQAFREYRSDWYQQMKQQPARERGALGMVVYKLSSEEQKRQLEKEFAKLPQSEENREALAYGRFREIQNLQANLKSISLMEEEKLQQNTDRKLNLADQLEDQVTDFIELDQAELAVRAIQLLGDAYEEIAHQLRRAPVPAKLEGEHREEYLEMVEKEAKSFEQDAQEARDLARQTAQRHGIQS